MSNYPPVLDVCCGSKAFYFNKSDARVIFCDKRSESHIVTDKSKKAGTRKIEIIPDRVEDFTALPFEDESFSTVVFDPPHLEKIGDTSFLAIRYGKLRGDWKTEIKKGFAECFRVLKPNGTLVFKWNEYDIKVSEILKLTDRKPVFGNRCGKQSKTHWIVFIKESSK